VNWFTCEGSSHQGSNRATCRRRLANSGCKYTCWRQARTATYRHGLCKTGATWGGPVINSDSFLERRSERLAALAKSHAVPAICGFREFATAGGLMSYGASITDAFRWIGVYIGRVLKGEKLADLPVQQATKVELIINLRTAKALALAVLLRCSDAPTLCRMTAPSCCGA
jgi:hypothetical protein